MHFLPLSVGNSAAAGGAAEFARGEGDHDGVNLASDGRLDLTSEGKYRALI
jgi:hypothetical protein